MFNYGDPNDPNYDPYRRGEETVLNVLADCPDLNDFELGELEETYIPEKACRSMLVG
jgi:hypothetical protein